MIGALIEWAWPYVLAIGGAAFAYWRVWSTAKKRGREEKELEYAKDRAEQLNRIRRANDARPTGSVHDDPNNRDNR